ncbi:MAG: mevalonate kinase [Nitrosopumilus sp.]|nr:mevalonate kinase [Nitrosopumilus sp.]MDH3824175.1 mevalonate kinase [Nitrosopumilus sp.]
MKSKASAPGKIILFGEHFVVYETKAILCAINKRVTVTAEKTPDDKISIKSSVGNLVSPPKKPISQIDFHLRPFYYLADKIIQKNNEKLGMEITIDSEIPLGVGLGSSSACCVAGAAAISGVFSKNSKDEILQLAIEAEKTIFPNTSGADCTVCTYGGLIQYDKQNGHSKIDSEPDFQLVIANSKMQHSTKEVVSNVRKFKEKNQDEFSRICNEENNLIEDVLVCLKNNDLKGIGQNMIKNQKYLESIGVSNEKLREMIALATKSSFGAKLTGAGGGGCIFALTDKNNMEITIQRLKENNFECFSTKIDFQGLDTL